MKITLLYIGKTKKSFIGEGIRTYSKRIGRYVPFSIIEVSESKHSGKESEAAIKDAEAEKILKYISPDDHMVILDERGRMISSEEFAEFINKKSIDSTRHLVFVIGGAYGLSNRIYDRTNDTISLSRMTFSHQLTRIIFLEQLYRSFTIIRGEPYHHG